jgi:hypothetical protein
MTNLSTSITECGMKIIPVSDLNEAETSQDMLPEGTLEVNSEFFNVKLISRGRELDDAEYEAKA